MAKRKDNPLSEAAAAMGRKGGKVSSAAKTAAAKRNIEKRWERVRAEREAESHGQR
jgi:hypothetical protein